MDKPTEPSTGLPSPSTRHCHRHSLDLHIAAIVVARSGRIHATTTGEGPRVAGDGLGPARRRRAQCHRKPSLDLSTHRRI
jgi:hypothetical protein